MISITLSCQVEGRLVNQVGGIITVTLVSIGQPDSDLIDGHQWSKLLPVILMHGLFFDKDTHKRYISLSNREDVHFSFC